MQSPSNEIKLIAFARSAPERDYLRSIMSRIGKRVVCFENEAICFDNLGSIDPHAVIARTDAGTVAWRFVFAMQALRLNCRLFIISNLLTANQFNEQELGVRVSLVPEKQCGKEIIAQMACDAGGHRSAGAARPADFLVGRSPAIKETNGLISSLMRTADSVMITGEAGTGKEKLARIIANHRREDSTFIKLDCSHYARRVGHDTPDGERRHAVELLENFKQRVDRNKPVTILLDKIHTLGKAAQSEFLLFLDEGLNGYSRNKGRSAAGIRFIATSEVDIAERVKHNRFRKALFYRLNVIPVFLPALRHRKEDIPLLVDHFSIQACAQSRRSFLIPSAHTLESLMRYEWPGNVDELKRTIIRVALSGDETHILAHSGIKPSAGKANTIFHPSLDMEMMPNSLEIQSCLPVLGSSSLKTICDRFVCRTEKNLLQKALEKTNWNRKKAAALLHISYKSMLNKMKMYEIV